MPPLPPAPPLTPTAGVASDTTAAAVGARTAGPAEPAAPGRAGMSTATRASGVLCVIHHVYNGKVVAAGLSTRQRDVEDFVNLYGTPATDSYRL